MFQILFIFNKREGENTKEKPSCDYYEVLDILKMGPNYDMGELTHIPMDKKNRKQEIVMMEQIQKLVNHLQVFKHHHTNL